MMMSRGVIVIALAAALVSAGAAAPIRFASSAWAQQAVNITKAAVLGKWAVSQSRCETEAIEFDNEGRFTSTLDENEPREGAYKTARDRIILLDDDNPDGEQALIVLDFSATRLVAYDETIESDRRLVKCR